MWRRRALFTRYCSLMRLALPHLGLIASVAPSSKLRVSWYSFLQQTLGSTGLTRGGI
jgi:hypothetical protein